MNIDALTACDRLVSATVNGLWQGIIITILVGLSLRLLRRTNAATRHAIWFSTLFLLVFLIPVHWFRDGFTAQANKDSVGEVNRPSEPVLARSAESFVPPSEDMMESESFFFEQASFPADDALAETEEAALSSLPTPSSIEPARDVDLFTQRGVPTSESDTGKASPTFTLAVGSQIPGLTSIVVLSVWGLVAASGLVRLAWRLWHLQKMKENSLAPASELNQFFQNLCQELGVRRKAELRTAATRQSPLLAGFLRPMILFPAELTSSASRRQAEQILRHELAHLQRHDDWINLVQQCIQTVLFFHPAVLWISRQLSLEREIACDDHVLHQAGRARSYALLLANLAAWTNKRPLMLAPGVSTNKSQLQQRINMILDTHRNTSPRLAKSRLGFIASVTAAVAALAIYSAPRIVLAQSAAPAPVAVPAELPSADTLPLIAAIEESGPKYKPGDPADLPTPAPVAIAGTPAPPNVPPTTPMPAQPPRRFVAPRATLAHGAPRRESSIEERLARLEEMVRELIAQRDPKHANLDFHLKRNLDEAAIMQLKEMEKMKGLRDMEKMNEHGKREAARAGEEVKRATKEVEKVRKLNADRRHSQRSEALGKQLEALQKARESLEREMEKLQHQIEELQQSQEDLDEEQERDFEKEIPRASQKQ